MEAAKAEAQKWLQSKKNSDEDFSLKGSDAKGLKFSIQDDSYEFKIAIPATYPGAPLTISSPNEELEDWVNELNDAKHTNISDLLTAAKDLFDSLAEEEEVEEVEEEEEEEEKPAAKGKAAAAAAAPQPMEEDAGFEIEVSDGEDEEGDVENEYYEAKALRKTKPDEAIKGFKKVLEVDTNKSEWGFKALKQSVKLLWSLKRFQEAMKTYQQLLNYISSNNITKNDSKKAINTILNMVSNAEDPALLESFYSTTLDTLLATKNDQLWFQTKLKLAQLKYDVKDFDRLRFILNDLKKSCTLPDGSEDPSKGGSLLEIYALEIQMYTELKDRKRLKELVEKSAVLAKRALVSNPRVTGIIKECSGKMNMREGFWAQAHEDFFEAFKSYDEAGNQRRIDCLRYLVLANMLMSSGINPFAANEAKPYETHPDIQAMKSLVDAYQRKDIKEFERILKANQRQIMGDSFMKYYIDDLLRNIRTLVLVQIIRPYNKIRIAYIAQELNVTSHEVEDLAVDLILDGKIDGQIDEVNQLLQLYSKSDNKGNRYQNLNRWAAKLHDAHQGVLNRISAF